MTTRDDDALHWAGDDDPTLTPPLTMAESTPREAPANEAPAAEVQAAEVPVPGAPTPEPPVAGVAPAAAPPGDVRPLTVLQQAELAEDAAAEAELIAAEKETAQLGSAALITLGILGGIYLLYTVGWAVHVGRSPLPLFPLDSVFLLICYQVGQFFTIAAAPLWFVSTLLLTQKRPWRSRLGWLLLGVFVLVPWPFILGV